MHLLWRALRRHYKMKRRALILNGEDVLTHAFHGTYVITHYTVWYSLVRWSVGSDCFLTTTEPLQSLFLIEPRPPRSGDLGPIVLARIRARLPCSHMPKRTELRGETRQVPKQQARCESTQCLGHEWGRMFYGYQTNVHTVINVTSCNTSGHADKAMFIQI